MEAKRILQLTYFTDISLQLDPEIVAYTVMTAAGKITKDRAAVAPPQFRSQAKRMGTLIAKELKAVLEEWTSASGTLSLYSSKSELASTIKQTSLGEFISVEDVEKAEMKTLAYVY
jgi:anti-anti-sigma regulatory factor